MKNELTDPAFRIEIKTTNPILYSTIYKIKLTLLQAVDLLVGERRPVALQLPLQAQPHLRVLVAGRVVLGAAVRAALVRVRVRAADVADGEQICSLGRRKRTTERWLCLFGRGPIDSKRRFQCLCEVMLFMYRLGSRWSRSDENIRYIMHNLHFSCLNVTHLKKSGYVVCTCALLAYVCLCEHYFE